MRKQSRTAVIFASAALTAVTTTGGVLARAAVAQTNADRTDSEQYTQSRADYWAARAAREARRAATDARKAAGIKDDPAPSESADAEVPAQAPAPAVSAVADGTPSNSQLSALRMCESTNDYSANTGNGYYGAYQFSAVTWWWLGYSGYPHNASPAVQDQAVRELFALNGWSPWPACSRYLGFR